MSDLSRDIYYAKYYGKGGGRKEMAIWGKKIKIRSKGEKNEKGKK